MPNELTMPQLSDTMTEGVLVKWHKKEGDKVEAGDEIADVETDKATMPMEAFEGGTLAIILAQEGDKVSVGDLIGVIASASEDPKKIKAQYANAKSAKPAQSGDTKAQAKEPAQKQPAESVPAATSQSAGQPVASVPAKAAVQAAAPMTPAAPAAAASSTTPLPAQSSDGRIPVSPLARRMAADLKIDLSQVKGSGPGGRIVKRDIESAAASAKSAPTATASLTKRIDNGQVEEIELSKMRQTIAIRLQQSKQQLPHFYETIDIDVTELSRLRGKLNQELEAQNIRLSISDLVNMGIAAALRQHPALNAHYDAARNRIVRYGDVHLGIAVALPDGLIVPVLRNIDQMGLREIRQRSVDLATRARAQRLKRDELSGATFSVSTLGAYGIREFNAIINPPEVAILAIGSAEKRAVVRGDQIVARQIMTVTLSADHRAVDGATAAEFLRTLRSVLEEPGMMLV